VSRKKSSKPTGVVFLNSVQAVELLHNNACRYDEVVSGGLLGGINTFAYVSGNPITCFDPDGLQKMPTSGRFPGLTPLNNASFCATAFCAAGIPQGRAKIPESLRPQEGMQCTARVGSGIGATVSFNSETGLTYFGIGPQLGASLTFAGGGLTATMGDPTGFGARGSLAGGNGLLGFSGSANVTSTGASATFAPGVGSFGASVGVTFGISR
jgi:hypothetical protein